MLFEYDVRYLWAGVVAVREGEPVPRAAFCLENGCVLDRSKYGLLSIGPTRKSKVNEWSQNQ